MRYPDFVKNRPKGTVVKRVGDAYHVYYATTKRVPEKSYPVQVIKGYAGTIDEEGFHPAKRVSVYEGEVRIREYGFTNYLLLFEDSYIHDHNWGNGLRQADRKKVYHALIGYLSGNSYLHDEENVMRVSECVKEYGIGVPNQLTLISKMIERDLKEIEELKQLCRVSMGGRIFYSELTEGQKAKLEELNVDERDLRR